MTSTETGQKAESATCEHLKARGYTIVDRNWRTRWCEIDIVARKQGVAYFVEVKYRSSNLFGDGLDYITPKKLQQMTFAAEFWVANNRWTGEYALVAVSVTGTEFAVKDFIEL